MNEGKSEGDKAVDKAVGIAVGIIKRIALFFIRFPFALIFLSLLIVFLIFIFLIIAFFAADEENGIFQKDDDCQATAITVTGTISGSNITLNIEGENDFEITGINGKVDGDTFTAEKEMTEEEIAALETDAATTIWNFFRTRGYSEAATAAILGNFYIETAGTFDPSIHQIGGGPGRGLAQWSYGGSRWTGLLGVANERGTSWDDLETQLIWTERELNSGAWIKDLNSFKSSTDVDSATEIFCNEFEVAGKPNMSDRKSAANDYYERFSGKLYGDISLEGTINDGNIDIEGSVGSVDLIAAGTIQDGEVDASGYLGDTTNCVLGGYRGGQFVFPAPEMTRISSYYAGRIDPITGKKSNHGGMDLAAPGGSPILACADGKVVFSGYSGSWGNRISIDHGNNLYTLYAHASRLLVDVGDQVKAGQEIAKVGSTGRSTGNHLHLEVWVGGYSTKYRVDPYPYIFGD